MAINLSIPLAWTKAGADELHEVQRVTRLMLAFETNGARERRVRAVLAVSRGGELRVGQQVLGRNLALVQRHQNTP